MLLGRIARHSLAAARLARVTALAALVAACSGSGSEPTDSLLRDAGTRLEPVGDASFRAAVDAVRLHNGIERAERRVFRSQAEWASFWARATATSSPAVPAPQVDFTRHMVVVVALGARSTGGYWVEVDGAYVGERLLTVEAIASSPGEACITTQAFTQPLDAALIPRSDLPVEFDVRDFVRDCR